MGGFFCTHFLGSNKDGTDPLVPDADKLDEQTFELLKSKATEAQKEHIKQLGRYEWTPAPLLETKAFTSSEEVRKLNEERFNFGGNRKLAFKHSPIGRRLRRMLAHLST